MAQRVIQNSFVAGEIAPELYGRSDLKPYFQGAASIGNFIVRKSGGLRKRSGTHYVQKVTASGAPSAKFRLVPLFVRRDRYAAILLIKKAGSATIHYRTMAEGAGWSGEQSLAIAQFPDENAIDEIKTRQIGDTVYFAYAGMRTFKAKMSYTANAAPTAEWETIKDTIAVETPTLNAPSIYWPSEGKDPSKGYVQSSRTYGLFGVKSNIYSAPARRDVAIWLPWIGSATVTLSFTPDFSKHDYYVLAMMQGADWGVVATFFPSLESGSPTDVTAWSGTTEAMGTIGETSYTAGSTAPNTALRASDPNATATDNSVDYHANALMIASGGTLSATYKTNAAPILAVRVWFGGLLRSGGTAANVGTTGDTTVTLKNGTTTIQEWHVSAIYSDTYQTLQIDDPKKFSGTGYTLTFASENGTTPVVVRGIVLVSDSGTRSYVDRYYAAGSVCGIQERLTVGDGGMDCGLIDVWQQRLMFAASRNLPFTLWFSQINDLYNFYASHPQTASDAFSATIPATRASRILHSLSGRRLMLFTESGEYEVSDAGNSGFSFATISIQKTSNVGAHPKVEPVVAEEKSLFVAADGRSVYDLAYSLEQDNIVPKNRSLFAAHLTENARIVKLAYQRYPDSVLWCLLEDGTLLSLTYLPEQDVFAWAHHAIGGPLKCIDIGATDTTLAVDGCDPQSVVLLTMARDDAPATVWIERLRAQPCLDEPDAATAECADHAGYPADAYPVAGTDPKTDVEASVATLPPDAQNAAAMGMERNAFGCTIRITRSGQLRTRPLGSGLDWAVTVDAPAETSDGKVPLRSGTVKVLPRAWNNASGQMEFASADKWPCEILALCQKIEYAAEEEGGG